MWKVLSHRCTRVTGGPAMKCCAFCKPSSLFFSVLDVEVEGGMGRDKVGVRTVFPRYFPCSPASALSCGLCLRMCELPDTARMLLAHPPEPRRTLIPPPASAFSANPFSTLSQVTWLLQQLCEVTISTFAVFLPCRGNSGCPRAIGGGPVLMVWAGSPWKGRNPEA